MDKINMQNFSLYSPINPNVKDTYFDINNGFLHFLCPVMVEHLGVGLGLYIPVFIQDCQKNFVTKNCNSFH